MIVTGIWLLLFVVIHLKTFKFGPSARRRRGMRDLSRLVNEVYRKPLHVVFYVLSMVVVGMHLSWGLSSAFQSMGFEHPRYNGLIRGTGLALAIVMGVGLRADPLGSSTTDFEMKLVNPANKRKYTIIVVGTGLAGASAAASLGELGYNVKAFCFQDSPRRAHSIAAQGGINAAKNYQNDGDSVYRLFYDTVKGGDYRAREANVYRLAQISVNIIDQCVAPGRPVRPRVRRPARQPLVRRRPGLAHLLRPRPDRASSSCSAPTRR